MGWLARTADIIADEDSDLWKICYPKRILPPVGYHNPKEYSVGMWGHQRMWLEGEAVSDPHFMVISSSLALMHRGVPTYFVEPQFATAIAKTRLPDGLKFSDLRWPLESMLLVLNSEFTQKEFGYDIPFLALNRILQGNYPHDFHRPELRHLFPGRPLTSTVDRMVVAAHAYTEREGTPTEYSASYPLQYDLTVIKDAPFSDATEEECQRWGTVRSARMRPEDDRELTNDLVRFAIKFMLIVAAAPRTVRSESLARPEKRKGKRVIEALWNPAIIGLGYRISKTPSPGASSGDSVRTHLRWGHWTHQFKGTRGLDFVSTAELPRHKDGTVDWASVPEETRLRFWQNHELKWIEPVVVNPPK